MLGFYEGGEFRHRYVRPGLHGFDQIALKRRQPSARRPPLAGRFERPGLTITAHQFDDEARRHVKLGRCRTAGMPRLDTGHDPATKVQ